MENSTRQILLDAALEILGHDGAASFTIRAVEATAGVAHGSVRHHFGDRAGMVGALFEHLAERERAHARGDAADTLEQWLGPGRTLTLARYELFLMAARDSSLRPPLITARDEFVAQAADRVGEEAARTMVAALDGLVLDALVRGSHDPALLRAAVARIMSLA